MIREGLFDIFIYFMVNYEGARKRGIIVAIDGTAGCGKSTTAKAVARSLGYLYLDTGAMYRAFALKVLRSGIPLGETSSIGSLAEKTYVTLGNDDGEISVFLDGEDVTALIRSPEISSAASVISAVKHVREVLANQQRKIGEAGGVVAEGRDMGTVVFPVAGLKIFMTASLEERAKRRRLELQLRGIEVSDQAVLEELKTRDERDTSRANSPLRRAPEAVEIDTTSLTIEEQVARVLSLVKERTIPEEAREKMRDGC